MTVPILEIKNVSKNFIIGRDKQVKACQQVSFCLERGSSLGIVGESGCGKSTLMRLIMKLMEPTAGEIIFEGKDIAHMNAKEIREYRRRVQMIFQDPLSAFNPRLTVRDIVLEPLRNFKLLKGSGRSEVEEYLRLVQLDPSLASRYPHELSGGQRQRVALARALIVEPEVLVLDEATCALDMSVQDAIARLLVDLQIKKKLTYLFICHDMAFIQSICHQIAVMYLGRIVESLPANAMQEAKHPYTKALLRSIFAVGQERGELHLLKGELPDNTTTFEGCSFAGRCNQVIELCHSQRPEVKQLGEAHHTACHCV